MRIKIARKAWTEKKIKSRKKKIKIKNKERMESVLNTKQGSRLGYPGKLSEQKAQLSQTNSFII